MNCWRRRKRIVIRGGKQVKELQVKELTAQLLIEDLEHNYVVARFRREFFRNSALTVLPAVAISVELIFVTLAWDVDCPAPFTLSEQCKATIWSMQRIVLGIYGACLMVSVARFVLPFTGSVRCEAHLSNSALVFHGATETEFLSLLFGECSLTAVWAFSLIVFTLLPSSKTTKPEVCDVLPLDASVIILAVFRLGEGLLWHSALSTRSVRYTQSQWKCRELFTDDMEQQLRWMLEQEVQSSSTAKKLFDAQRELGIEVDGPKRYGVAYYHDDTGTLQEYESYVPFSTVLAKETVQIDTEAKPLVQANYELIKFNISPQIPDDASLTAEKHKRMFVQSHDSARSNCAAGMRIILDLFFLIVTVTSVIYLQQTSRLRNNEKSTNPDICEMPASNVTIYSLCPVNAQGSWFLRHEVHFNETALTLQECLGGRILFGP